MKHVALIGHGAVGREVAHGLLAQPSFRLTAFLRKDSDSVAALDSRVAHVCTLPALLASQPDLVVEVAGHQAVRELVRPCLAGGIPVVVTSIGALHDDVLFADLSDAARTGNTRLILPSGALGGLDVVRAARHAPDLALRYTSTKPPAAWHAELTRLGHDPANLACPTVLFEGDAREAAARYPQNLNVAAALALSGPGFAATAVKIVCDPAAKGNSHIVEATSALGTMRVELVNSPSSANPKTSKIVSQSVLAAIAQFFSPVLML